MEFVDALTLAVAIVFSVGLVVKWTLAKSKYSLPSGPTGFALYRGILKSVKSQTTHLQLSKWAKEHGEVFSFSLPGQKILVLSSVETIRKVFNGSSRHVTQDRPPSFLGKYYFHGYGITFGDLQNKSWKQMRQLFHSGIHLHADGGQKLEATLNSEITTAISEMEAQETSGDIAICEVTSSFLLHVLHIFLTGERPSPGSTNLALMKQLDDSLNMFLGLDHESVLVNLPFLRFLPCSYGHEWKVSSENKRKITDLFFTDYKKNFRSGNGLIDKLLDAVHSDGSAITEGDAKALICELIGAGYVTSKAALMSLFLVLLCRPDIQEKLHAEIDDVLGDRKPSIKDMSRMPYFEACVMETVRYNSLLPTGIPHLACEDFILGDWNIPKGTVILSNLFHANHDADIWEEPWEFRPERFLEGGQLLSPMSDTRQRMVAFGSGKRRCPGENFAKTRIFMFVTSLLQKYELVPPEDGKLPNCHPLEYNPGLILMPDAFKCRIKPRTSS